MIDAVATICIFVNDQDKAKAFYTDVLGFELRQDSPMGESRWLAVAPGMCCRYSPSIGRRRSRNTRRR